MVALVVDELAGVAQNGGGGQPALVLRRQLVQRLQLAVKLHGVGAHRLGLIQIDAVAPRRGQHALPALVLKLAMSGGARVLLGQHLRQNAVAQSQRRIAEASSPKLSSNSAKTCAPATIISARRGPMPGTASRSASVIWASFAASLRTSPRGERPARPVAARLAVRQRSCLALCRLAAGFAAARRNRLAQRRGRARGADHLRDVLRLNFACARRSSRAINCRIRASPSAGAGSAVKTPRSAAPRPAAG